MDATDVDCIIHAHTVSCSAYLCEHECPVQGSDPGSGSGRTDQDATGKGEENLALTDEDLQARRIRVSGCDGILL